MTLFHPFWCQAHSFLKESRNTLQHWPIQEPRNHVCWSDILMNQSSVLWEYRLPMILNVFHLKKQIQVVKFINSKFGNFFFALQTNFFEKQHWRWNLSANFQDYLFTKKSQQWRLQRRFFEICSLEGWQEKWIWTV